MKKPTTFQQERLLFFLNFLRFHAKTYEKDFFLATDATTQYSNKEENEKEIFFFLFNCKMKQ
jgi:hypothetical protein